MTLQQLEREMVAQPIRSLQYMLNRLSLRYDFLPALVPDGVFGERTLEAVMLFQRELLRPVTGVVDRRTWDEISRAWSRRRDSSASVMALKSNRYSLETFCIWYSSFLNRHKIWGLPLSYTKAGRNSV